MRHQFRGIGERFAAHGALSSRERSAFLGVALHVPIHGHLGRGLEVAKAALELFDRDFVHAPDVLLKESPVLGHMTALSAFIARLGVPSAFLAVDVLDMDVHVLFAGAFIVAIRAVKGLQAFVNRVLVGDQISTIGEAFVALFAGPGPLLLVDHLDVLDHIRFFVESVAALQSQIV